MPRYDFICTNCRSRFDYVMTYSEYESFEKLCKNCKGELIRVWSPPGIIFK